MALRPISRTQSDRPTSTATKRSTARVSHKKLFALSAGALTLLTAPAVAFSLRASNNKPQAAQTAASSIQVEVPTDNRAETQQDFVQPVSQSKAEVTVNGQPVTVPDQGTVNQVISDPEGNEASVQVNVSNHGSSASESGSTTKVQINSRSTTSVRYSH